MSHGYETKLFDPVSGIRVDLFAAEMASDEVYHPHTDVVLQMIQNHYKCDKDKAYSMLVNSDMDNPIMIGEHEYWVE